MIAVLTVLVVLGAVAAGWLAVLLVARFVALRQAQRAHARHEAFMAEAVERAAVRAESDAADTARLVEAFGAARAGGSRAVAAADDDD